MKRWLEKAERDLCAARKSHEFGEHEWACFQAQQAAEKALKALDLKLSRHTVPTHDLVLLARRVALPAHLRAYCKQLTMLYSYTRYPDTPDIADIAAKTPQYMEYSGEILQWVKQRLSEPSSSNS